MVSLFEKLYISVLKHKNNQVSLRYVYSSAARHKTKNIRNQKSEKIRASSPAPNLKGLMTVEAAVAGWIFLLAVLSIISIVQVFGVYACVRQSMMNTVNMVSVLGVHGNADALMYVTFDAEKNKDNIWINYVDGGTEGISLFGSRIDEETGDIYMRAHYDFKPVICLIPGSSIDVRHFVHGKLWTGYHKKESSGDGHNSAEEVYYVADYESVYHTSAQCTHLLLSISMVDLSDIYNMRNNRGGLYTPCEKCSPSDGNLQVFVTDTGNRYHSSLNCSGLKRSVHQVSDVRELKKCSRCGGVE